jgi:flavodoxin
MNRKKRLLLFAMPAAVLGIGAGGVAFTVMAVKDQTYVPSAPYAPGGEPNREVAVVYYSRSGHSEAAAREIARTFNAPIARINADYPRDFSGQRKAVSDARAQALPPVRVEPIDLAPARRVFLVSPTWMFRPATPLWTYVEQAALTGKRVVLVTTGNSRFEQAEIDAFAKRVEAHGGRLVSHVFLRRGRIFWQKSREELLKEVRAEMEAFK